MPYRDEQLPTMAGERLLRFVDDGVVGKAQVLEAARESSEETLSARPRSSLRGSRRSWSGKGPLAHRPPPRRTLSDRMGNPGACSRLGCVEYLGEPTPTNNLASRLVILEDTSIDPVVDDGGSTGCTQRLVSAVAPDDGATGRDQPSGRRSNVVGPSRCFDWKCRSPGPWLSRYPVPYRSLRLQPKEPG